MIMSRSPFYLAFDRLVWRALIAVLFLPSIGLAQLQVTCPTNVVTVAPGNSCGAVVNYDVLYSTNLDSTIVMEGGQWGDWLYWQVPPGVGLVNIKLWGAQGNKNADSSGTGGLGGYVEGDLPVLPGEYLYFEIGSGGNIGPYGNWSGGGNDAGYSPCYAARGGGGGGSSSVMQGGTWIYDRVMVAGGGGGAGGNREQGCGRGTGGGGGGGWYGGGGGAAWPYSSRVHPMGGDQFQGGQGGTSTYTGNAPANNGYAGSFYYGGYGGEEIQSAQGGNGVGANGGNAGGIVGDSGTYSYLYPVLNTANNFTGQSGAGGSSYIRSNVQNASMAAGVRTGTGRLELTYPMPVTQTLQSGLASGSTFPLGTTTVQVLVEQTGQDTTCVFTVRVDEIVPPDIYCPPSATVSLDANCSYIMPDYTSSASYFDNCTPGATLANNLTQSPLAGTVSYDLGLDTVWLYVADNYNLMDSCWFAVEKIDGSIPLVDTCPSTVVFQPYTLDCNPSVQFNPPSFSDNCPGNLTITSNYQPGDNFVTGNTTVTYVATDEAGYNVACSFTVKVLPPIVDSIVDIQYSGPCEGDTVTLVADSGYVSYLWSTFQVSQTIQVLQGGTYTLKVRNGFCQATDTFEVNLDPAPVPVLIWTNNPPQFCTSQTFPSYQWYRMPANDSVYHPIAGATSQCYQPTQTMLHKVVVTHNGNSCISESVGEIRTGVDDQMENPGFVVYPNPAGHEVNIEITEPIFGSGSIRVFDAQGKAVIDQAFDQMENLHVLNLSNLPAGSYTIELKHGESISRAKIIHVE